MIWTHKQGDKSLAAPRTEHPESSHPKWKVWHGGELQVSSYHSTMTIFLQVAPIVRIWRWIHCERPHGQHDVQDSDMPLCRGVVSWVFSWPCTPAEGRMANLKWQMLSPPQQFGRKSVCSEEKVALSIKSTKRFHIMSSVHGLSL